MSNNTGIYEWCKFAKGGTVKAVDYKSKPTEIVKTPLKATKPIKKASKHKEIVTKKTYNTVFARDKGQCKLCGLQQDLQLHHISSRGKDLTNNILNCCMLCKNCHLEIVHKENKKYRPILKELIERGNQNDKNK